MHPASAAELSALNRSHYGVFARLSVADNPLFQGPVLVEDVLGYNPFIAATVSADLDQPVMSASIRCHLGTGTRNLSPHMYAGARIGGTPGGRPVLDPGRYLQLETRCIPYGPGQVTEIPWRPVFKGRIDDADPAADEAEVLVIQCRDVFADLLDTWIQEGPDDQGGWAMPSQRIDSLLFNLVQLGMGLAGQMLYPRYVNGIPTLQIPAYRQMPGSLLLAMREAALQSGSDLRGKWGAPGQDNDTFVLWYYEPDRVLANAPLIMGPERYFALRNFKKSRDEVRNDVSVTPANPPRLPVKLRDETSILNYGDHYLSVSEDKSSFILEPAQATALASAILSDLKDPKIGAEIETRYFPFVEINDRYQLTPNNVHHDLPMDVAISGFTHTISGEDPTTVFRTRQIPAAANEEWRNQPARMLYVNSEAPVGVAASGALWIQP